MIDDGSDRRPSPSDSGAADASDPDSAPTLTDAELAEPTHVSAEGARALRDRMAGGDG